jgi:phosphate acetyltransferase
MDIRTHVVEMAKKLNGKVILPESADIRVLQAAYALTKDGTAKVILPTKDIAGLKALAQKEKIDLAGIEVLNVDLGLLNKEHIDAFIAARAKKGMSQDDALKLLNDPVYFSMMYLKNGKCDACVCGAVTDTADVLRAAIHTIGTAAGIKLISSYFLMIPPPNHPLIKEPLLLADCAVNPNPDADGLKDIGVSTVASFNKLFPGKEARVSYLSFSTKGSAKNEILDKVIDAVKLSKECFAGRKDVNIDGEMQFDASIVESIGKRKAPGSAVAGRANILIFPDLNAGNIGYKIAERLGGFQAVGPLIQGLALPVSDLSRGCSADDIYLVSAVMLLR